MHVLSVSLGKWLILLGCSIKSLARVRKTIRNVSLNSTVAWADSSCGVLSCDVHCLGTLNIDAADVGFPMALVAQRAETGSQWQALLLAQHPPASSPFSEPVARCFPICSCSMASHVCCYLCSVAEQDLGSVNLGEIPVTVL